MKIRRKDDPSAVIPDVHESVDGYYKNLPDGHRYYSEAYYEPIPDKQWVDVTGDCEVRTYVNSPRCILVKPSDPHFVLASCQNENMRFVKETLYRVGPGQVIECNFPLREQLEAVPALRLEEER